VVTGRFPGDRSSQTAAFDAVLTVLILMMATTAVYAGVVSSISATSESRASSSIRAEVESGIEIALDASIPSINFTNRENGLVSCVENVSGASAIELYYKLSVSGVDYDTSDIEIALKKLVELVCYGRFFAIGIEGPNFSQFIPGPGSAIDCEEEVPHPRVAVYEELLSVTVILRVVFYVWG
jgi:hypothetical protein